MFGLSVMVTVIFKNTFMIINSADSIDSTTLLALALFGVLASSCGQVTVSGSDASCALAFTTETEGKALGLNDGALGGGDLAQSFTLTEAKTVSQVQLKLRRVGMTSSSFQGHTASLGIESNNTSTGKPSGTALSTSDATLAVTLISTTPGFYTFTFSSSVSLAAGIYWLRLKASYPTSSDSKNLIQWVAHDGSNGAYSDGSAAYKPLSTEVWETGAIGTLIDLLFKVGC